MAGPIVTTILVLRIGVLRVKVRRERKRVMISINHLIEISQFLRVVYAQHTQARHKPSINYHVEGECA